MRAAFHIRPLQEGDREWAIQLLRKYWGSERIVSRGRIVRADESAGLVASVEDERVGLLTYEIRENECEIISLNSLREHFGVGSALLAAAKQAAQEARCRRVWLITTNDNLSAIGFYQRRGMQLKAVYPNALAQSRKIKPEIPLVGNEGIPLRDEIELEYLL